MSTEPTRAEHVLGPDDLCPCGQPQEAAGYCSYGCFSEFEMGSPIMDAETPRPPAVATPKPRTPSVSGTETGTGALNRHRDAQAGATKRMTDAELENYRDLIDMHSQYGSALSWAGEAKLLTELEKTRADLESLRPVHYREAAASLRAIADADEKADPPIGGEIDYLRGWRHAANRLESVARDLEDEGDHVTTSPQGITEPLTDEHLETIRARVDALAVSIGGEYRVHAELAADVPALLAEVDRLRAEVERRERQIGLHLKLAHEETKRADALAAKAEQAWSEGHSAALAAGCDREDQFRANLGVLLVAEEQRCQMAINENPLDPHLHGRLTGLQRARDIVTGDAFPAALGETGGTEEDPSNDEPWLCPCGKVNFGPLGECTHSYTGEQR